MGWFTSILLITTSSCEFSSTAEGHQRPLANCITRRLAVVTHDLRQEAHEANETHMAVGITVGLGFQELCCHVA